MVIELLEEDTGNYTKTFYDSSNSTNIPLGDYYNGEVFKAHFKLHVYDAAGNEKSTQERTIYIDTIKPKIIIKEPGGGEYLSTIHVTVEWTITEDYFENASIKIKRVSNGEILDENPNAQESGQWTGDVAGGEYKIKVIIEAVDKAGNENETSVFAYIDTVAPSLYDLACNGTEKNGIWYVNTRNVALSWDGGDTYFSYWVIERPSGNLTITNEGVKSKVISLSNGEQNVTLYAFDLAGNYNEKSIDIVVDTAPPEFYFACLYTESHKDNDTYWSVPAGDVPFSFTFYDNYDYSLDYYVTVSLDSTIVYSSSTPLSNGNENSINLNMTDIPQGVYDLTMKIQDSAGNVGEKTFEEKVIVDTKKPTVSFSTGNETVFGSTSISVTVEVEDISHFNFAHYNLSYLEGNAISPMDFDPKNRSSGTFTLNYEVSSNGTYLLSLQIVDLVGNSTTTDPLYLYVDLDPPKIESISIGNWSIYGVENITAYTTVSDDIGLKNVSLILDGELVKVEEPKNKYASVNKSLTGLSSSRHNLTVVAFDLFGRKSSDYVIFFVDKESPTIENYTEGIFSSNPVIEFTVSDDLAIKNLSLTVSNDTYSFEYNGTFDFREEKTYDCTKNVSLSSGDYNIEIWAWDFAGRYDWNSSTFTIDRNDPSVDIKAPEDDEVFGNKSFVYVRADVSDWTSLRLRAFLNSRLFNETAAPKLQNQTYTYAPSIPIEYLTAGENILEIEAVDAAGNSGNDTVTFYIDEEGPSIHNHTEGIFSTDPLPDSKKAWTLEKEGGKWIKNAELITRCMRGAHYVINDLFRPKEIGWNVKGDKADIDHPNEYLDTRADINCVFDLLKDNVKKINALETRVEGYGKVKLGELDEKVNGKIDELGLRGEISKLGITRLGIMLDPRGLYGEYLPSSSPSTSYLPTKEVGRAMNKMHAMLGLRPSEFKRRVDRSGQFVRFGMVQSGYDVLHAYRLAMAEGKDPENIKFTFEGKGGKKIKASLSDLMRVVPILANTKYGGRTAGRIGGDLSIFFEDVKIWGKGKDSAEEYLKNGESGKFKGYPNLEGFNEGDVDLALAYFTDTYKPEKLKKAYEYLTSEGTKKKIDDITGKDLTDMEKVDRIMEGVDPMREAAEVIEPITEKLGEKIGVDARGGVGSTIEASGRSTMISMSMSLYGKTQKIVSGKTLPQNVHKVAELMMHKNAMKNLIDAIEEGKVEEGVKEEVEKVGKEEYIKEPKVRVERVNNALDNVGNWKAIAAKSELQLRQVASGVKGGVKSAWKYIFLMQFLGMLGLSFGMTLYYKEADGFEWFADAGKWVKVAVTVIGSVAMVFMMNAEDQRLYQAFGEKGAKIDNVNMLIGGFLSGFLGIFTGLTGIKIYQGEIEDAIGNALIDHGMEALGKNIKRVFGFKIPLTGKSIGQAILEYLLAGGITTMVQTVVNLILSYIMKMVTNYIAPWVFQLFGNLGKFDIVEAFGFQG